MEIKANYSACSASLKGEFAAARNSMNKDNKETTQHLTITNASKFYIYNIVMTTHFKDGSTMVANGGIVIKPEKVDDAEISVKQYMNTKGVKMSIKLNPTQIQNLKADFPVDGTLGRNGLKKHL